MHPRLHNFYRRPQAFLHSGILINHANNAAFHMLPEVYLGIYCISIVFN